MNWLTLPIVRTFGRLLAVTVALLLTPSCGLDSEYDSSSSAGSGPKKAEFPTPSAVDAVGTAAAAFVPSSLQDLTRATPTILVGRECGTEKVDTVQGVDFAISRFCVIDVVRDDTGLVKIGSAILLRQSGFYRTNTGALSPLVNGTQPFMIFVQRFEFEPGQPTDQWTTIGVAAGVWVSSRSEPRNQRTTEPFAGLVDQFQAVDPDLPSTMPRSLTTGDVRN